MTSFAYHRLAQRFYNAPLALLPSAAETISAFLQSRIGAGRAVSGGDDDSGTSYQVFAPTRSQDGAIEVHSTRASRFHGTTPLDDGGRPLPFRRTPNGVAIITMVGELVNRGSWIGASSGLISYEGLRVQLQAAVADQNSSAIVLDIESPGGEAVGAFETAAVVRAARQVKPVIAVINGMAASAAYAIASGASRIVTLSSGLAGSIGVVMLHVDFSKMLADDGIKPTLIFAGAHKVDGNVFEPLTDTVRRRFQVEINGFYEQFIECVSAGRPRLSTERVRNTEARMFMGAAAVTEGLADSVGTLDDVLGELADRSSKGDSGVSANGSGGLLAAYSNEAVGAVAAAATLVPAAASQQPTRSYAMPTPQQQMPDERAEIAAVAGLTESQRLERWKAQWNNCVPLNAEFSDADSYAAYMSGLARGRIRILGRRPADRHW